MGGSWIFEGDYTYPVHYEGKMTEEPETTILHRQLDPDGDAPEMQILDALADIEGTDVTELPPLWNCVDGMVEHLFSTPPDPEAQMTVEFSYSTYRITIEQDGSIAFVKTE